MKKRMHSRRPRPNPDTEDTVEILLRATETMRRLDRQLDRSQQLTAELKGSLAARGGHKGG